MTCIFLAILLHCLLFQFAYLWLHYDHATNAFVPQTCCEKFCAAY